MDTVKNLIIVVLIVAIAVLMFGEKPVTGKVGEMSYTYLLWNSSENTNEDVVNCMEILTFNENNVCIDTRILYEFKEEEIAKEQYERWNLMASDIGSGTKNVQINFKTVTFNSNSHNGMNKSEILNGVGGDKYLEI